MDYPWNSWKNETVASIEGCRNLCDVGCDFFSYNSNSKLCQLKFTEKSANTSTLFRGTTAGVILGQLSRISNPLGSTTEISPEDCLRKCVAMPNCLFVYFLRESGSNNG